MRLLPPEQLKPTVHLRRLRVFLIDWLPAVSWEFGPIRDDSLRLRNMRTLDKDFRPSLLMLPPNNRTWNAATKSIKESTRSELMRL